MSNPIKSINWSKDPKVEFLMKDGNITWEIQEVRYNDLNLKESEERQSRLDRELDTERVMNIGISVEAGLPLPMMVLYKIRGVGYVILAGLHRAHGVKLYINGRDNTFKVRVYVITDGDPNYITDIFPSLTNAVEGVGLSMEQRKTQAAELVVSSGYLIPEIALKFGLRESLLEKHISEVRTRDDLIAQGVTITKSLTKGHALEVLRGLVHNTILFRAAGHFLSQHELLGREMDTLVKAMKSSKSEQGSLNALSDFKKTLGEESTPSKSPLSAPRRSKFHGALTTLENILRDYPTWISNQITVPEDRHNFETRIADIVRRLSALDSEKKAKIS